MIPASGHVISPPYRTAVVGLGKIAMDQHLPALADSDQFVLMAAVDSSPRSLSVPTFASVDGLLASGIELDAIAICTPPQARVAIAERAIDAGLAVLLEKPPATSVAELAALQRRADMKNVSLFAAWHSRYAPMVPDALAWLQQRVVARGHIRWREDVRKWHPGQRWLWQQGGLGVFDPGINAFSILTALLPMVPVVVGAQLDIPENAQTPISAQLQLSAGGAPIAVELDFLETKSQRWEIMLETECGHRLLLADGGTRLVIDDAQPVTRPSAEYPALYAHFAQLIWSGTSDADDAPLALVAEALSIGKINSVEAFIG